LGRRKKTKTEMLLKGSSTLSDSMETEVESAKESRVFIFEDDKDEEVVHYEEPERQESEDTITKLEPKKEISSVKKNLAVYDVNDVCAIYPDTAGFEKRMPIPKVTPDPFKKKPVRKPKLMNGGELSEESEEEDVTHPLLKKIKEEMWFPSSSPATLAAVVSAFIAVLEQVGNSVHTQICDYIVEINNEIGYPDDLKQKLVDKLLTQLNNRIPTRRENAIRALGELGVDSDKVLDGLLPTLIDKNPVVKSTAAKAIEKLTGVKKTKTS